MASTYTPIATTTLGANASSVTFSSISSAYTDLVLIASPTGTGTGDVYLLLNSDGANNYSRTVLDGNGTSAVSARSSSTDRIYLNYNGATTTANPNLYIFNIMNYANTTTYKTVIGRNSNAANATAAIVGLWRSTSAISTIYVAITPNQFATGSTFTLYGIKAA